jgi:hypothetical protein
MTPLLGIDMLQELGTILNILFYDSTSHSKTYDNRETYIVMYILLDIDQN